MWVIINQKTENMNANKLIKPVYNFLFKKDPFNDYHFEIGLKDGWQIEFSLYTHEQYIAKKTEALSKLMKKVADPEKWIEYALRECRQASFIIFDCGSKRLFVQFWLGSGKMIAIWPTEKDNDLKKYTYAMLGVLNELDIHRRESMELSNQFFKPSYIIHQSGDSIEGYDIYFRKEVDKAIEFTKIILRDVFEQDLSQLNIKLG